ncbi:carboxypeptidase regulatory-like domain-containing protein [Desulfosoma caldarium]|uniref:Nickel transport protein n=1 Tax=Desulfosoma caldarium TaxID=610254 RepID=A0A3N1UM80_9BACT|nr:carboxypeptidase regulatory-like domain-containing protein [Desulfosoma caldarium]ROQ92322.1 nickel transport protein [Desulfosoma caldarium]
MLTAQRNSRLETILAACCILIALTACLPVVAWGHKVNLFAYAEGGTVYVESYFPDGSPVVKGKLRVTDAKGTQVFEGTTDAQGKAQFAVPSEKSDLTLELNASMGHRAVFTLKKTEM